jgi:hypothetical protein
MHDYTNSKENFSSSFFSAASLQGLNLNDYAQTSKTKSKSKSDLSSQFSQEIGDGGISLRRHFEQIRDISDYSKV